MVTAYKNLKYVERDFRHIKSDDLDLRPVFHYLEGRVRAHVLICMLAQYLVWHLRRALAPLTYTDEHPPVRANPVAPATRSAHAERKAARHTTHDHRPVRSFRGLLDHLATLTRDTIRIAGQPVDKLAAATPDQRRAFDRFVAELVAEAVRDGDIRSDADAMITARLLFGLVNSIVEWYRPDRRANTAPPRT